MTTDELLDQMAALLKHGDHWQARAFGQGFFAKGNTPREAMARALGLEKLVEGHWAEKFVPEPIDLNPNSDLF